RERLSITRKCWNNLENSRVKSTINLVEREFAGIINHDERSMSQEPGTHRCTASISWRVTSTNELNAVKSDPSLIRSSPETILFDELTDERDGTLRTILVRGRQVDFIAEDY